MSVSIESKSIIQCALEAGFMLSTAYGQFDNKLMPVSDSATLNKFAELVTAELTTALAEAREETRKASDLIKGWMDLHSSLEAELEKARGEVGRYQDILRVLVALKAIKDIDGKTDDYLRLQPLAWEKAFSLCEVPQPVGLIGQEWANLKLAFKLWFAALNHPGAAVSDKKTETSCQTEQQSWKCPNMKGVDGDTSMESEYYECKVCGRTMVLHYSEMS